MFGGCEEMRLYGPEEVEIESGSHNKFVLQLRILGFILLGLSWTFGDFQPKYSLTASMHCLGLLQ